MWVIYNRICDYNALLNFSWQLKEILFLMFIWIKCEGNLKTWGWKTEVNNYDPDKMLLFCEIFFLSIYYQTRIFRKTSHRLWVSNPSPLISNSLSKMRPKVCPLVKPKRLYSQITSNILLSLSTMNYVSKPNPYKITFTTN